MPTAPVYAGARSAPTSNADQQAASSDPLPINEGAFLSQHSDNPAAALSALVSRYNALVRQHATLQFEKQAAEKAADRVAVENQQLWRSLKSMGSGSNGSSPRPVGHRQNSEGLSGAAPSSGSASVSGSSSRGALPSIPLRRGMSNELYTNGRPGDTSSLPAPLPVRDHADDTSASLPIFPSVTPSFKTTTPPPVGSPRTLNRSASHNSIRKAASLDLGRSSSSVEVLDASPTTPPTSRFSTEQRNLSSPRFPTSASMPLIPMDHRTDEPDLPQSNPSPYNLSRRLLPSIVPVSPLQISSEYDRSSPVASPSPTSPHPPSQLLPPSHSDNSRRVRSSSNNSSSSQNSAPLDAQSSAGQTPKLSPLAETSDRPLTGLFGSDSTDYSGGQSSTPPQSEVSRLPGPQQGSSATRKAQTPTRPSLTPDILPWTRVRVPSSNIKTNEKGKEVISFVIDVTVSVPSSSETSALEAQSLESGTTTTAMEWRVEKLYSEVLTLDSAVKNKASRQESKSIASLPDKSLFKDHAPHKRDQRKAVLERYLQSLLTITLRDRTPVCAFFTSDIVANSPVAPPSSGVMEGWLTKRGRNFGGWQTRYYVLAGDALGYYDTREGSKLGEISLHHAAIGRQSSRASDASDDSYLHAFLIRTTTKGKDDKDQDADHILCAESDEARDAWVVALTSLQSGRIASRAQGSFSMDREREPANGRISPEEAKRYHSGSVSHLHHRQRSGSLSGQPGEPDAPRLISRRNVSSDMPPSVSMPASLDLLAQQQPYTQLEPIKQRTNSEQGRAQEQQQTQAQYRGKLQAPISRREGERSSNKPSSGDRPTTPDRRPSEGNVKIATSQVSGPMNATPLPSGTDFKKMERQKKTKSSFWNFAARSGPERAPTPQVVPHAPARPVFGVPLKEAVAISRIRPGLELPAVVYRCVEYLEAKNAESEEGIFRLSGSANVIRVLKDRFNAEGDVQLLSSAEYYDPHAIAGLLKAFLRELPVHILTRELHPEFIQVIDLRNRKDRVNALGKLVARLPIEEYTLFRFFFAHLCVIAQNHEVSKMNLRNLGIVFSPTLAIPAPLFSLLLSEFDLVFAVEKETGLSKPIMVDDPPSEPEPELERRAEGRRPRPNSELYERSGAPLLMEDAVLRGRLIEHSEESEQDSEADDLLEPEPTSANETNLLGVPSASPQPALGSPLSSPRTASFGFRASGLPASPRPGATFASQMAEQSL